jgi:hypothetical protein
MSDEATPQNGGGGLLKWILIVLGVVYALGSAYYINDGRERAAKLQQSADSSKVQIAELGKRLGETEANSETLASQLGMTKKELEQRSAELQSQQRAAQATIAQQKQALSAVSGEVAGVKGEVGGVKTDVATTKTDLAATKAQLERTIGDLGIQSGLIARTRDDLDVLKHRGDRNYYEFTLYKGKVPTPLSTVALQLKKTDSKRGKYTMNVVADDRTIEKKDKNMGEPIQFYTGRDHMLYEMVVWTVDKDKATGYLSTPKGAPTPVSAQQ